MRFVVALTTGFVLWIALWAITNKGFDSLLVFVLILVVAATYEIVVRYLPNRE
jgi:hypothetical protein